MGEFKIYDKTKFKESYIYTSGDMELFFDIHYGSRTIAIRNASVDFDDEFILEAWRLAKELMKNFENDSKIK